MNLLKKNFKRTHTKSKMNAMGKMSLKNSKKKKKVNEKSSKFDYILKRTKKFTKIRANIRMKEIFASSQINRILLLKINIYTSEYW